MSSPRVRDISMERRRRAAACVDRHLAELASILNAGTPAYRLVEGSAVAAEVYLAETNTTHTAVRVAIFVAPRVRGSVESTLRRAGFEPSDPTGDATLLRLAARGGRRAVHVLFGGDADDALDNTHPAAPAAARQRAARLGSAWLEVAATLRRARHGGDADHAVTESFEVQLIEG